MWKPKKPRTFTLFSASCIFIVAVIAERIINKQLDAFEKGEASPFLDGALVVLGYITHPYVIVALITGTIFSAPEWWPTVRAALSRLNLYLSNLTKGSWVENKFIFDEPFHVLTTEFKPEQNGTHKKVKIKGVKPNSFVQFEVEYNGGLGYIMLGRTKYDVSTEAGRRIKTGMLVDDGCMVPITFHIPENSNPTIARIYIIFYEDRG